MQKAPLVWRVRQVHSVLMGVIMYKIDYSNGNYIVIDNRGYEANRNKSAKRIKNYLNQIGIDWRNCEVLNEARQAFGRK